MISVKKLLYKMISHTNYRSVEVDNPTTSSIAAGQSAWITVPFPPSGKAIAVIGWYTVGSTTVFPYCVNLSTSGAQFAFRNVGTSGTATFTLKARYLVVD